MIPFTNVYTSQMKIYLKLSRLKYCNFHVITCFSLFYHLILCGF
jgi:hypothetical protein